MAEIYPFAKLFAKYFEFGNSPNINPVKHSHCTVYIIMYVMLIM